MTDDTRTQPPAAPAEDGTATFGPPDGTGTFHPPTVPSGGPPAPRTSVPAPDIPGYELLEEVGAGGMGRVYRARQLAADRVVAVKLMLADEFASAAARERFRVEIAVMAKLSHPHIVQLYEAGEAGGRAFLSCEFMPGGSLASKLDGTPWEAKRAARLLIPLARAVGHAHASGVIHRDLKPGNILLGADGQPKVADFGVAKRLDSDVTGTGSVLGTPSYMPPEQAGSAKAVGPAADVYALGAILYELLTGRPPFKGADFVETLDLVRTREPVPPRELSPRVPRDAETICLKCLQKDPARRYASADALADDLGRFLEGRPIVARPVGPAERAWRWCRRNPAVASLLAAVLVVFAAGAGVASYFAAEAGARAKDATDNASEADRRAREANAERERADAEARRAGEESERLRAERDRTGDLLYTARMSQAGTAAEDYRGEQLVRLLDETRPRPGEKDRRGWEWHYLNRLARGWSVERTLPCDPKRPLERNIDWRVSSDRTRAIVYFETSLVGERQATAGLFDLTTGALLRELPSLVSLGSRCDRDPGWRNLRTSSDLRFAVAAVRETRLQELPPDVAGPPREEEYFSVVLLNLETGEEEVLFSDLVCPPSVSVAAGGERVVAFVSPRFFDQESPAPRGFRSRVYVWERGPNGPTRATFPLDTELDYVLAVTPDARYAAFGVGDASSRQVELWSVAGSPARIAQSVSSQKYPRTTFSPGGRVLAFAESDAQIAIHDTRTGAKIGSVRMSPEFKWGERRLPEDVSDDGRRLVIPGQGDTMLVAEWLDDWPASAVFGPPVTDPTYRANTWRWAVLRYPWLYRGDEWKGFRGHHFCGLGPDGRVVWANDDNFRVWNWADLPFDIAWHRRFSILPRVGGEPISPSLRLTPSSWFRATPDDYATVNTASPGRRVLYSARQRDNIRWFRVHNVDRPDAPRDFALQADLAYGQFSSDGASLLVTTRTKLPLPWRRDDIERWSLRPSDDPTRELAAGTNDRRSYPRFSQNGRYLIVTPEQYKYSGLVRLYRASDGRPMCEVPFPPTEMQIDARVAPSGGLVLVSAPEANDLEVERRETNGRLNFRFYRPDGTPCGEWVHPDRFESYVHPSDWPEPHLFFSDDGGRLGVASLDDEATRVWVLDTTTGECVAKYAAPPVKRWQRWSAKAPYGSFGPNGRVAVWSGEVITWAGPGAPPVGLDCHRGCAGVAFTADGRRAFVLDDEVDDRKKAERDSQRRVRVWSLPDGHEVMSWAVPPEKPRDDYSRWDGDQMWLEGERLHVQVSGGIRVFDGTPRKE